MKSFYLALTILCFLKIAATPLWAEEPGTLSVGNEFIKIIVNNDNFDKGRFAIETTYGDPKNSHDNFQPLIYGRPKPWTSYTTILIDGKEFVFGEKTQKRAGKSGIYGEVTDPKIESGQTIVTTTWFPTPKIKVIQHLQLFRNPSTKVKDSALISYEVLNLDTQKHTVGIRMMLDTMLGKNDGAPFRIGERAIESEIKFEGEHILNYWQAFDDLSNPTVIAQGSLRIPEEGIYPPNRLYLVNWGKLADNPWDFEYIEGQSFTREGETEKDTALALYWDKVSLPPSKTLRVKTLYGLGGVSVSPGALSLGLTAPAELYATSKSEILVVGYITNTGGYDSKNTVAKFDIPKGLKLVNGQSVYPIDTLKVGESRQLAITLLSDQSNSGDKEIKFSIESATLESNVITRSISLLPAPKLKVRWDLPAAYTPSYNPYIPVTVYVTNTGKFSVPSVNVYMFYAKPDIELPIFDIPTKSIDLLGPNQTVSMNWQLKIKNQLAEKLKFVAKIVSPVSVPEYLYGLIQKQNAIPQLAIEPCYSTVSTDQYFYVWLSMQNKGKINLKDVAIQFDSDAVQFVRTTPELWFKQDPLFQTLHIEPNHIVFDEFKTENTEFDRRIAKFHFKALKPGQTTFTITLNGKPIKSKSIVITTK